LTVAMIDLFRSDLLYCRFLIRNQDEKPHNTHCVVNCHPLLLILQLDLKLLRAVLEDERVFCCVVVPPYLELGLVARDLTGVLPSLHFK